MLMKMFNDLLKRTEDVDNYWDERMPMMAMEEMAEAQKAISKLERYLYEIENSDWLRYSGKGFSGIREKHTEEELKEQLTEELGDVMISIFALLNHYEIDDLELDHKIDEKLKRTYD